MNDSTQLPEIIEIIRPVEEEDQIFTIIGVRNDLVNNPNRLEELAWKLNENLKCEGAFILLLKDPKSIFNYSYDLNYYLALFIQTWG
jgi:hypothetical protein